MQRAKSELRVKMHDILRRFSSKKRAVDSAKVRALLPQQSFWKNVGTILFYASLPDELDLWPALEETLAEGKIVALPCFDANRQHYRPRRLSNLHVELVSGQFGIREPAANCIEIPLADLDLVLVPGVAFDLHGYRLGRGKGFYDRMLTNFAGCKMGIAFDEQVVNAIPAERQDVRMDFILTPTRCVRCDD